MAEWKMNILLLHFADDHGLGIALPGFERLAMLNAFSANEIKALVNHAEKMGVEIIPEIEVFGHTKYITRRPEFRHLFANDHFEEDGFSAVDPKNPDTVKLMSEMLQATAKLFNSRFIHIGCDEVGMKSYCEKQNLDEAQVWCDYVNTMIGITHAIDRIPMLWSDHPAKNAKIAKLLRKDVWLVEWRYDANVEDSVLIKLIDAGFKDLVTSPSLACYLHRFFPAAPALRNTFRLVDYAQKHRIHGVINTIWCPWRYLQNAMYYGIAYSANLVHSEGNFDLKKFHLRFSQKVFAIELSNNLNEFLTTWPKVSIDNSIATKLLKSDEIFTVDEIKSMKTVEKEADRILALARNIKPTKNIEIWNGMLLATKASRICAKFAVLRLEPNLDNTEKSKLSNELEDIRIEMSAEWDRTRFHDDPQKYKAICNEDPHQYAMILIEKLQAYM
jgi:hypothetical protein